MSNFDPIRDCKHGRQKGKCDSCDLEQAVDFIQQQQQRISELERQNSLMRVIVNCVKPHPKNPDGVSIEDADGYEWLQVILELNELTKGADK